jgi:hypothetical protein
MNLEIRKLWAEALRSGQYKQGNNYLKYEREGETYHCCLGVLCEVYQKETNQSIVTNSDTLNLDGIPRKVYWFDHRNAFLPRVVTEWAGLSEFDPHLGPPENIKSNATFWNDDNKATFDEIADLVEAWL